MRELTRTDPRDAASGMNDATARQIFESYGADLQSLKIKAGIGAVTGALTGLKAGPAGVFVGAALGALAVYWKGKAYRMQVYAQLDALGLLRRPTHRYRDVTALARRKFAFLRYPYGEQTALIILPLLQKYYPDMTDAELTEIGTNVQKALLQFRRQNQDIPIALAAEGVLAFFGVVRNAAGEYDLIAEARAVEHYQPPAISPPPPGAKKKPSKLIYYIISAIILLMLYEG